MPQKRQPPGASLEEDLIVRSLGLGLPPDYSIGAHSHDWHQVVYATAGVMIVDAGATSWSVPPERAVWIPAGFVHAIRTTGPVTMRTLYLRPEFTFEQLDSIPAQCRVIHVRPLLRELVLEVLRLGMLGSARPSHRHLASVLLDQISGAGEHSLHIPMPLDVRARRVVTKARADLSRDLPLAELARGSGASMRTIERLFVRETGMTYGRWLQRAKALRSLEELSAGKSVTAAALSVGYDSTSAYIAMFKRVFGVTPGKFFRWPQGQGVD